MSGGRKPGRLSFHVIEVGKHLHRQPLVPDVPAAPTRGRVALAIAGIVCAAFAASVLLVHLVAGLAAS